MSLPLFPGPAPPWALLAVILNAALAVALLLAVDLAIESLWHRQHPIPSPQTAPRPSEPPATPFNPMDWP